MKKTIRIIYLTICGILTIGFMLWAVVQGQEAEKQRMIGQENEMFIEGLIEYLNEYERNFDLLRNDSLNQVDIDSLYENSICLQEIEKQRLKVEKNK